MKIDRLLAIITMLLNRERISAAELAKKFEVSIRTIYRDIEAINMAGIPIVSQAGNNGGFYIVENYKINHQFLTLEDKISIVEALKNINRFLDNKQVELAIEKIKSIVPKEKRVEFDLHFQHMVIDNLPWGFKKTEKENLKYKVIYAAVENKKCIAFNYRNSKGECDWREVEPLTLVFKGFSWYLFSFCKLRSDYRLFKLSRIDNLAVLEKAIQKDRMSYEKYEELNKNKYDENKLTRMILKFSNRVRYRIEDNFDISEIKVEEDGSLIVDTRFREDEWVYSMILSYGESVEVIEPYRIRKIIKDKSEKIYNMYSNMT